MKRILLTSLMLFLALLLPARVLAEPAISIPINTIVRGDSGSRHLLAEVDVEEQYIGQECDINAVARNQESVHQGNNLEVSSAQSMVVLENVERERNVVTIADGKLILSDKVTVTLVLGADRVFSGGLDVNFECQESPKDIVVCRDGEEITIKENERLETDTNPPCPEEPKEIQVCRDGKEITIKEDERLETDTDLPCPSEGEIQVCRDGKVITIKDSDRIETDTNTPCPVVLGTATTLPNTGAGTIAAIVTSGLLGTIAHSTYTRRRS